MNKNYMICKVCDNIFKVTRYESFVLRKSLVIKEQQYSANYEDCKCSCIDNNGFFEFYIGDKLVLKEYNSPYTISFEINQNDAVYGLGIHQNKPLNYRNNVVQMVQTNGKHTAVPFLTSTGGYAILIDNYSYMSIGIDRPCDVETTEDRELCESLPNTINIFCQDNTCVEYYIILADTIDSQIAGYRKLTGQAPLFSKWAYGFFQSREHYQTQEEVLNIASEFRSRHIPIDCIVQDWNYWGNLGWNALLWDNEKYPDPKKMIDFLHNDLNLKIMLSVWPGFGKETEVCKELEVVGGILEHRDKSKENWGRNHDVYNKAASDIVWAKMKKQFFDIGVDAWWLDSTEPSFDKDSSLTLLECSNCILGENKKYLNTYAFKAAQNIYENQRSATKEKRVFILTRSGFAGQQSNATLTWTGDIKASWDVFKAQIISLLNFSASGIPYSTTDIGAFFVEFKGGYTNDEYKELYTRWFWFGAFSPVFRSHGTNTPREIWFFGEEGTEYYDSQLEALRLRYRLLPYIYSEAFKVYRGNSTLMRLLSFDFPEDKNVHNISDCYMFGESLLVGIVTDYKARTKTLYLPQGEIWYDYFTGKSYEGGNTITVHTPINRIALFVKAGSILLTGEDMEYTSEKSDGVITVSIYPGKDASTVLYEDQGDNYNYEKGEYATIEFLWSQSQRTLSIGDQKGQFKGLNKNKTFHIVLMGEKKIKVDYDGTAKITEFRGKI